MEGPHDGQPRSFTTTFNTVNRKLEQALKANGITKTRRPKCIERFASGRPANLASEARISLALRRIAGSAQV